MRDPALRQSKILITRFDGDGPVRIVVAHENVTQRKLAEQALRESEDRFSNAFEFAPMGLLASGVRAILTKPLEMQALLRLLDGYMGFRPVKEA